MVRVSTFVSIASILTTGLTGLYQLQGATHSFQPNRAEGAIFTDPHVESLLAARYGPTQFKSLFSDWARSYYTVDAHMQAILAYDVPHVPEPVDPDWATVKTDILAEFAKFTKTIAMDFHTQLKQVPYEESSSAGYLLRGPKGPRDGANFKSALNRANRMVRDYLEGTTTIDDIIANSVPDIGFTRTQLTYLPDKLKVRNVWGEDFAYILLEGLFAYPLMKFFVEHDTFFFIGRDPRDAVPTLINDLNRQHDPYFYAFDWSHFDATVQVWEITFAFQLLESILIFPNDDTRKLFHLMRDLFINRKVAAPNGNIYFKTLGVPSGSYFTILIDSIVNYVRIMYIFKHFTKRYPRVLKTQGDDSLALVDNKTRLSLPHVKTFCDQFHWTFNAAKTSESPSSVDIEFLSRTAFAGSNYRDPLKLERLALYPEYPVESGEISLFRVASILEESSQPPSSLRFVYDELSRSYDMPKPEHVPKEHKGFIFQLIDK